MNDMNDMNDIKLPDLTREDLTAMLGDQAILIRQLFKLVEELQMQIKNKEATK